MHGFSSDIGPESQVWQPAPWIWRNLAAANAPLSQVATGKVATGSGSALRASSYAVDGTASNVWPSNTCSHTQDNPPSTNPPWVQVSPPAAWCTDFLECINTRHPCPLQFDLGQVYSIWSIVIFPRMDCCTSRNQKWQIFIGNNPASGTITPNLANNTQCLNVPFDITPPRCVLAKPCMLMTPPKPPPDSSAFSQHRYKSLLDDC